MPERRLAVSPTGWAETSVIYCLWARATGTCNRHVSQPATILRIESHHGCHNMSNSIPSGQLYIYIYIYICVCVCVYLLSLALMLRKLRGIGSYVRIKLSNNGLLIITPNFYTNKQFYFKQFSLAWVHSLIVKKFYLKLFSLVKEFYFK